MLDRFKECAIAPEDIIVTFPKDGRLSTQVLLGILIDRLADQDSTVFTVSLGLDEYMALCGLDDMEKARAQAKDDLDVIFDADVTYKAVKGRLRQNMHTRLLSAKGILSNKIVMVPGSAFKVTAFEHPSEVKNLLGINSRQ